MNKGCEWAATYAVKSPVAVKHPLKAMNEGMEVDLDAGREIESLCARVCFTSNDSKEDMKAFLEKRRPTYTGG